MVSKEQALSANEFHYAPKCDIIFDNNHMVKAPKPKVNVERWRRNGATKTWKTRPNEFRVPVKYGLRDYSYISDFNAHEFHVVADCPLNVSVKTVINEWGVKNV